VYQAVENIASISEENSAAIEELSASAQEMSAQAEEVSSSALALSELAQGLKTMVTQFRLADEIQGSEDHSAPAAMREPVPTGNLRRSAAVPLTRVSEGSIAPAFPTGNGSRAA
jgi:hypothetical protein